MPFPAVLRTTEHETAKQQPCRTVCGLVSGHPPKLPKLGHGGFGYIAGLFGCDRKTIRRGLQELAQPAAISSGHSRKKGVGKNPV
jgi:hypothetical protein